MTEHNPAPSPAGHPLLSGPPTLTDIHQIFTASTTSRAFEKTKYICRHDALRLPQRTFSHTTTQTNGFQRASFTPYVVED